MLLKRVMQILQEGAGVQFDPRVLEVFRTIMEPEIERQECEKVPGAVVELS